MEQIQSADEERICAIEGIGPVIAKNFASIFQMSIIWRIYDYFSVWN